ncbi:hypothetical protein PG990_015319 [Apiospora arundinis]|uniref:Uncharacterized protein n=1 Tax=Apiospora arundinis TaxID=335852 RepID=A0ABR2HLW0_9PEZI
MRFSVTAAAVSFLAATAVSGLTIEEAKELRPVLDAYVSDLGARDLNKRNFCTKHWKTCDVCFEKYSYCHQDNIPSSINCLATCSSCPGKC